MRHRLCHGDGGRDRSKCEAATVSTSLSSCLFLLLSFPYVCSLRGAGLNYCSLPRKWLSGRGVVPLISVKCLQNRNHGNGNGYFTLSVSCGTLLFISAVEAFGEDCVQRCYPVALPLCQLSILALLQDGKFDISFKVVVT